MEHIEKNAAKSYTRKDEDPVSGLNLRLRHMIEDFDELINTEHDNTQPTYTSAKERVVKIAS